MMMLKIGKKTEKSTGVMNLAESKILLQFMSHKNENLQENFFLNLLSY